MIGVPTNWQQMRYCIVAALDKIGGENEKDRKEIYGDTVQFFIERICNGPDDTGYLDWTDRSPYGKAFYRALDSLRGDRTVTSGTDDGYRLAWWDQ